MLLNSVLVPNLPVQKTSSILFAGVHERAILPEATGRCKRLLCPTAPVARPGICRFLLNKIKKTTSRIMFQGFPPFPVVSPPPSAVLPPPPFLHIVSHLVMLLFQYSSRSSTYFQHCFKTLQVPRPIKTLSYPGGLDIKTL